MKQSEIWNFNLPELSDPIDVREITRNFELIDLGLEAAMCRKTRKTNTLSEQAYPPAIRIKNYNDFDIEVVDRAMLGTKIEIKAGEIKTINIRQIRPANFFVEGLHEAQFEWYIPTEKAIEEGGGGSGGTSNYNDLENQPKINNVTLTGNKSFQDLGLLNSDGVIKSDFLPPFVDNMDSYPSKANFPAEGVEDRLYLAKDTNLAYVWTGVGEDKYACVGTSLALGETSSTAYRGDRGKTAYDHSQSTHARTDATKTEASQTNGNIKINGTETPVYQHPGTGTNPHGTTAADLGLDKALKYSSQSLSETDKAQARQNIGAGTSSFNGQYSSLTGIPQSFTPASHTHPSTQVTGLGAAAAKGVDTTMPASATDNNVPTTQLMQSQLNKKANKTEVSLSKEGGETTSVINVTDAKAQMAMVAKISGKTIRANIFSEYDNLNKYTIASEKYNGHDCITSTQAWGGASDSKMVLKTGKTYYISFMLKSSSTTAVYRVYARDVATSTDAYITGEIKAASANTWFKVQFAYTATSDKTGVRVESNAAATTTISEFMVSEYNQLIPYCPPSSLASAPVESVVSSISGNASIIDNRILTNNKGTMNVSPNRSSTIPVECVNKTLAYEATSKTGKILDTIIIGYDANGTKVYDSNWTGKSKNIYTYSDDVAYVGIAVRYPDNSNIIVGDISVEWNQLKTTVLVPSSVKNLPDYGCSAGNVANEIDFENGIYYHRVGCIDLGDVKYTYADTYGVLVSQTVYSNLPAIISGGSTNCICSKYDVATTPPANVSTHNNEIIVCSSQWSPSRKAFFIKDTSIVAADIVGEKVAKLNGVKLYYAFETPEVIPLSDYLRPLPVENGGTLTLVNEHNLDMPSVIKYKKEVN